MAVETHLTDARAQITFLQLIQRLFDEGEFQATYKYALLLTLVDLAVEYGQDDDRALCLSMDQVSAKYIEIYWRQLADYGSGQPGTTPDVLAQNLGKQVALINVLQTPFRQSQGRLSIAMKSADWHAHLKQVGQIIRKMPLKHLQILGGEHVPFLYDEPCPPGQIVLKPGVAFHLRRYQPLIQQLARSGWVAHIRSNRLNAPLLGHRDDLETFMFGTERAQLQAVAEHLADIQQSRCFYCRRPIDRKPEVDHFIPWSRYPRDTAHNFVLAHKRCNADKRALLAVGPHLTAWLEQIDQHGAALAARLGGLGFLADVRTSRHIAHWAYGHALAQGAMGWLGPQRQRTPITASDLALLSDAL